MPDYNPAVAAGIAPPQTNLLPTLEGIAQLQIGQAHAGLYSLQALQQQKEFNGLQAANDALANNKPAGPAYLGGGGQNPNTLSALQQYEANKAFAATHGGQLPAGAETSANIGRIGAETTNIRAALPGILSENQIKAAGAQKGQRETLSARATDLYNNPSPDNAQDMLDDHSMHMTTLNRNRLQLAIQNKDTDAIRGMASEMQAVTMTPEERAKFVQGGMPAQQPTPAQVATNGRPPVPQPAIPAQPTTLTNARGAAAQTAAGSADVDYTKKTTEAAGTARQVNTTLSNLSRDAEKLPVGRGMAERNEVRAWMQSVYDNNIAGAKSWMPDPGTDATAAYDSMLKNSGMLTRQALMQTHERAAVAYSLIQSQLPGPDTSRAGLKRVVSEWQGINDEQDYKQRVMSKTPLAGRSDQFESDWNTNVNPLAFILNRMDSATRSQVIQGLKQSPEGRQTLSEVDRTVSYLKKYGF